jgi:hypothetical protein
LAFLCNASSRVASNSPIFTSTLFTKSLFINLIFRRRNYSQVRSFSSSKWSPHFRESSIWKFHSRDSWNGSLLKRWTTPELIIFSKGPLVVFWQTQSPFFKKKYCPLKLEEFLSNLAKRKRVKHQIWSFSLERCSYLL